MSEQEVLVLPPEQLVIDGDWPVDPGLRASIEEMGQITPISVADLGNGKHKILDGRGRVAVCKALGIFVKAIVREPDPEKGALFSSPAAVTLAGNVTRPNRLSEARALQALEGTTDEDLLRVSGLGKGERRARLALLRLAPQFQKLLEQGDLSVTAAKQLVRLTASEQAQAYAAAKERAGKPKPSAIQIDWAVREIQAKKQPMIPVPAPAIKAVDGSNHRVDPVAVASAIRKLLPGVHEHQAKVLSQAIEILEGL